MQFDHLCKEKLTLDAIELNAEPIVLFTDVLCIIAKSFMPKTTTKLKKRCMPWFNTECKHAMKARKSAVARVVFFLSRYLVSRLIVLYLVYCLILNVPFM